MFPDKISKSHHTKKMNEQGCLAARHILDRISDKWSLYIIVTLSDTPLRYNEIRRRIVGVSQRMLTLTLRGLETDGMVKRTIFQTNPVSVEYSLTELGRSLLDPMMELVYWADANKALIEKARQAVTEPSVIPG